MVWHVFNYVNMVWCERISGEEVLAGCESCRDTHHLPPAQLIVKFNCSGQVLTRRGNIYNTIRRIQILCIKMSRFGPESVNDTKLKKKKKVIVLWFFYVLSLTTTPHPLPGIWRPTQYHLTQGWKSLRPSMEDDCKHICIIRRTIWTLTLWKKSHVFFVFFSMWKIVWQLEKLALSLIHPFIILPIFLISIWHSPLSLAPSFPLCHPGSWR